MKNLMIPKTTRFLNTPTIIPDNFFGDFERIFNNMLENGNVGLQKGFPKGDVYNDSDGNVVVELALAGYSRDQLSVQVDNGNLVVMGEKGSDEGGRGSTLARRSFRKEFTDFNKQWNLKKADVSYQDGLLRIVAPPLNEEESAVELEIK